MKRGGKNCKNQRDIIVGQLFETVSRFRFFNSAAAGATWKGKSQLLAIKNDSSSVSQPFFDSRHPYLVFQIFGGTPS